MRYSENITSGYYPQTHLGEPINGLNEQQDRALDSIINQLKRSARLEYYCGSMSHYASRTGVLVLWLGTLAATLYATVWMSTNAAKTNHSVPDTIAAAGPMDSDGMATLAKTDCGLLPGDYVDGPFAKAAGLPSDQNSKQFQEMMRIFLFACNYLPNITITDTVGKNITFTSPDGNTCNDWVCERQGPDSNKGAVAAAFNQLTTLFGTPELALQCKNGFGFGGYVTGAVFFAIAAATIAILPALCGSNIMKLLCRTPAPDAEDYLSNHALRQRAEDWKNAKDAQNQQKAQLRTDIGGIFGLKPTRENEVVQGTEDQRHAGYRNQLSPV